MKCSTLWPGLSLMVGFPVQVPTRRMQDSSANGDAWTLKLGGPYVLDELIVDYASGRGETAPRPHSFKPSDPGVSRTSLGVYRIEGITKENGPSPIGYTIKRSDGLKPLEPLRLLWPKENSYWQVTIDKMGDYQAELFEKLADEKLFANPLVKKQVSERKLALGSMLKVKVETDVTFVGNTVTFRFFKPPKTSPTRVWMKFPVWPDEVKDQLARYKSSNEFKLPEKIESESPSLAGGSEAKLSPRSHGSSSDARWYEILEGPDGQVFERRFDIDYATVAQGSRGSIGSPAHRMAERRRQGGQQASLRIQRPGHARLLPREVGRGRGLGCRGQVGRQQTLTNGKCRFDGRRRGRLKRFGRGTSWA